MLHDVLIVVGIFAWLGKPIDGVFLAAALTIIGVSVNDSIVTMDRIRETWASNRTKPLRAGRERGDPRDGAAHDQHRPRRVVHPRRADVPRRRSLTDFALALLIGLIVGTYSSAFTPRR